MELTVIPRSDPRIREVCSSTLRRKVEPGKADQPLVFYEIVDAPGLFGVESTTVRRVRDPTTRARSKGSSHNAEDWQRPTAIVVRWGILRATTLDYVGGKERLPERLGAYLKKADQDGKWIREFTGEDRAKYQWRLEHGTDIRLYHKDSGKLVATYERGEQDKPNARRVTTKRPQLHITELGLQIVDQIILTWAIIEPVVRGDGASLVQTLRGV